MITPTMLAEAIGTARDLDLSSNHLHALCVLSDGRKPIGTLAIDLRVTTAAVTGIVDALERQNYLRRIRSREDRRSINVEITFHGREALADVIAAAAKSAWKDLTPT